MAQTGYTPILIYSSSTAAAAPAAGSLTNSTLGSELAINITDGKLFYKDNANVIQVIGWKVVPATAGGTGQTSYAVGDILYANTTTSLEKLSDVATGNALISGGIGVAPSWGKIGLSTHVSGTLPNNNGGTGTATVFTAGSIVFAGASGIYAQNNANFFWDDTNNRIGLGTIAPACTVDVVGGIKTSRTTVTSPATTDGNIFSGTYTPTLTNTTNIAASTAYVTGYFRVGNMVTVSGRVNIDPTAANTASELRISIPIASNFANNQNLGGVGAIATGVAEVSSGGILADPTNDEARFLFTSGGTAARDYYFTFSYQVL